MLVFFQDGLIQPLTHLFYAQFSINPSGMTIMSFLLFHFNSMKKFSVKTLKKGTTY